MTRHEIQVLREAGVRGTRGGPAGRGVGTQCLADCKGSAGRRRNSATRGGQEGRGSAVDRGSVGDRHQRVAGRGAASAQPGDPAAGPGAAGYAGGKSAVYELIRRLRPVEAVPLVRFEGVPGEFRQHDFGQVDVRFRGGGGERLRFLASRLKWSRVVHVTLVPDEREETLIRGLLAALNTLAAFGW